MIEEPVKPMKKKHQISFDEEVALKLQAEFDEEERLAREKAEKEKEANIALIEEWDDIQAKIDVDHQLAERIARKEQESCSRMKKRLTLYQQNRLSRLGCSKRAGEELEQESTKKQKVDEDKDTTTVKSPSIVGWKIYKEGKKSYYQIMRVDGKSQMYRIFIHMLKSFSSEDLYKLVKAKYESTRPVKDLDFVVWGDFEDNKLDILKKISRFRRNVRIKILLNIASITAAHIRVNAAHLFNAAEGVNVASKEVSTAELVNQRIKLTFMQVNKNLTNIQAQKTKLMQGILKKKMNLLKTALNCQYGIPILPQTHLLQNQIIREEVQERKKQVLWMICKTSKGKKREANAEAEALRKNLQKETKNLVTQAEAAKSSGTNIFSTVSTTAKASDDSENLIEMISEALEDESGVDSMQEELLQFEIQKVWILVDFPYGKKAIGTKWEYRNKKDERGVVVRNKARLVAQGHRQEEGIDY
ncbi:putative ribonuclease H-like domain-containing protein [Tanacetum coccineum]